MRVRIPIASALVVMAFVAGSFESAAQEAKQPPPELGSAEKLKAIRNRVQAGKDKAAAEKQEQKTEAKEEAKVEKKEEEKAEEKAAKKEEKAEEKATKAEEKAEAKVVKAEEKQEKLDEKGQKLLARLEDLRKTRPDRQKESRQRVTTRWGEALEFPAFRAELRRNARRVAYLNRMKELAELDGKTKVLQRVDKLVTLETGRHERRLQELAKERGGAAAPAAAAAGDKPGTVPAAATKEDPK